MYSIDYNGLCLYEVFCCLLILLLVFSAVMSGRPFTRTDRILRNAANIALQREVTAIEQRLQHEITTEAVQQRPTRRRLFGEENIAPVRSMSTPKKNKKV